MSNKKDESLLDVLDFIDEKYVGEVEKYYRKKPASSGDRFVKGTKIFGVCVAIAACVLLIALAMPTVTTIVTNIDLFPLVGAPDGSEQIQHSPEYDGSRGLLYEINENGTSASFIGYGSCTDETVYIASTYEGLPVTVMYYKGFDDSKIVPYNQSNAKNVKHLVISDTVKYVDSNCISQCPYIESVYFGASVENITTFNFLAGYGVKFSKVEVSPDNPYYSGKGNCVVDLRSKALVFATYKAVIPDDGSVEIIGKNAFDPARYWLCSIVIPEGVKIIDRWAFGDCDKLESVILPDSLEVIGADAFSSCKNLKKLELGTNLKAIDVTIFYAIKPPQVYYKGTVAQWEAVIKTDTVTRQAVSITISPDGVKTETKIDNAYKPYVFTVICSDGESSSEAGVHGDYYWRGFSKYKEYMKRESENSTHYVFHPDGTTTKVGPWEKYQNE